MKKQPKSFIKSNAPNVPHTDLPADVAMQLSPMQAEILTRVMNDNANWRLKDLLESHSEMADAVIAAMTSSVLGAQLTTEQKHTVIGLMKLSFLWGIRAGQEDWTARYESDSK